jgi:predicted RNA-binding protein with PIN domain
LKFSYAEVCLNRPFQDSKNTADSFTEKYVLALKCLVAASKLEADNAELKEQVARFKKTLEEKKATINEKILEAINEQLKQL